MSELILDKPAGEVRTLHAVAEGDLEAFIAAQPDAVAQAAALHGFKAKTGQALVVPADTGGVVAVLGLGDPARAEAFRAAPVRLPSGDYRLAATPAGLTFEAIALAWAMGGYRFERYRKAKEGQARLVAAKDADLAEVRHVAASLALARDLINTPANDMGPVEMEMAAREVAEAFGAEIGVVVGDALLAAGYPAVHAVGRAADPKRAPRMIEIAWGKARHPLVALVGKGVVFDSGGLDLKTSAGMRLMKKDMGGAAHALALARMVMAAKLPVRLVALLPVVENAVSGDAMRPGDVLASRKGLTIEVGNTDAEGRLILADALARAAELNPVLTLDFATLTGAARAALGPEVAPFYTDDEALAADLARAAEANADPLWRMPLWSGYEPALDSDIADVKNDPDAWAQAGSVTAALFLKRFAPRGAWAHFDIFAWIARAGPGRPVGAEAQSIRAAYAVLKARFG
ncbi:MAG TPA: leucyl aminopeptidase family protein [Caulobacteraceae bacterium]|nr:leucyl aminopeptidase family protein [Caulobacteraceae bacterium]